MLWLICRISPVLLQASSGEQDTDSDVLDLRCTRLTLLAAADRLYGLSLKMKGDIVEGALMMRYRGCSEILSEQPAIEEHTERIR